MQLFTFKIFDVNEYLRHSSYQFLMMGAETVSETLEIYFMLAQLIAREDFTAFSLLFCMVMKCGILLSKNNTGS
jgi:hypothetical protein